MYSFTGFELVLMLLIGFILSAFVGYLLCNVSEESLHHYLDGYKDALDKDDTFLHEVPPDILREHGLAPPVKK